METIIVICLIIIIVLLVQDKVVIQRSKKGGWEPSPEQQPESNIMGQPKAVERTEEPKRPLQSPKKESEPQTPDPEDNAVDEQKTDAPFPEETPADIPDELPDPEQQWESFEYPEVNDDFSTSVTYDELSTAAQVLKEPNASGSPLEQEAVRTVQKIEGTELFSLLENSIEGASQKIAKLLDQNINKAAGASAAGSKKNDLDNFDIGEFV